jgi:hypothetical protein
MKAQGTLQTVRMATVGRKTASSKGGLAPVIVRSLVPEDFEFVRSLAASITGYTVCPPYLLWMLSRLHGPFCAVAVAPDETRLGYLLAMPASNPVDAVFVWQLVTTFRGRRLKAQDQLASYLREAIQVRGTTQILFTSVPNSAAERSVRSLAKRVFSATPQRTQRLPESVSQKEREYSLSFGVSRKRRQMSTNG